MFESFSIVSVPLDREVKIDIYLPGYSNLQQALGEAAGLDLLLINDGQDLITMNFNAMLKDLYERKQIRSFIAVGIRCGEDRKNEYGMISSPDYLGRGARGSAHRDFVITELLPFLHNQLAVSSFNAYAYAGFSLGALHAFDVAWNHPDIFTCTAGFSGSFWWRSKDQDAKDYNEHLHRLMHHQVSNSGYREKMKFFFECGELDETNDRNKNGVIDSIDDTLDLIKILVNKGYREGIDISYLQLPDGRHDLPTWKFALPKFLCWRFDKAS